MTAPLPKASFEVKAPAPDRRPLKMFALTLAVLGTTVGLLAAVGSSRAATVVVGVTGFGAFAVMCLVSVAFGLRALFGAKPLPTGLAILTAIGPVMAGAAMSFFGAFMALWATAGFRRGRQLRRRGKIFLPPVEDGSGWSTLAFDGIEGGRAALAERWRDNGKTEHASVGAFAHLTLDLMALGAPSKLLMAAQKDSADEVRHAELCFSLARALDGKDQSPAAFPDARKARTLSPIRALALAHLAVDSLIDGAFHEGLSARMIAKLAKRCEVPAITAILKELAADEGRHAASGWDVVEWCIAEGGAPVRAALEGAAAAMPHAPPEREATAASDGSMERFGIHGDALEREEYGKMRADVMRRLTVLVAAPRAWRRSAPARPS